MRAQRWQHGVAHMDGHGALARICALAAALAFAFSLFFCLGFVTTPDAQAAIYPANSEAAADETPDKAQDQDNDADGAEEVEGETIEDEDTPLSDGLGGAEPIGTSFSFGLVAAVGIALVVAFFMALFRRLNGSMNTMNRMFK